MNVMKKTILSAIMAVAMLGSVSVFAQDAKPKKECCKSKTECKTEGTDNKECKKKCTKSKEQKEEGTLGTSKGKK